MRLKTALCTTASALPALALLSACSSGSTTAASASDTPLVGVDYPRSDTDCWNSYIKYTPENAKEVGLELKITNSRNDVAKLTANAQTFPFGRLPHELSCSDNRSPHSWRRRGVMDRPGAGSLS